MQASKRRVHAEIRVKSDGEVVLTQDAFAALPPERVQKMLEAQKKREGRQ